MVTVALFNHLSKRETYNSDQEAIISVLRIQHNYLPANNHLLSNASG